MLIFGTIGIFRRYIPLSSAFLAFSRGIMGGLCLLFFIQASKRMQGVKQDLKQAGAVLAGAEQVGSAQPGALQAGPTQPGSLQAGQNLPLQVFLLLTITGALMGINWILLFEAYNYTTVAVATLCYYMQPTIVVLLSPIMFRERLTLKKAVCAGAAILGMVLVSGVLDENRSGLPGESTKGVMLGLGAAVIYASVIILNKKMPGVDAYRKTTIQLFSAGIVMIPYLALTGGFTAAGFSPAVILLLLIVGIVHTGIAYLLYFASMDGLTVQSIAILSYIDPVSALIFSALLLREKLSMLSLIGAVLIIGSAIISEIDRDT